MMKSFFGLDLKTGGKVIVWAHLIENIILYTLSLMVMINSKKSIVDDLKTASLYQEELENHAKIMKFGSVCLISCCGRFHLKYFTF